MVSRKRASVGVSEPQAKYLVKPQPVPKAAAKPEPRCALLDVNVLIALLDADHLHHARAAAWLAQNIQFGWASCAITQNGCVRIMSQPGYPNALPAAGVAQRLREATLGEHHLFVPGDVSLLDPQHFDAEQLLGHRQVTDAWLLGLAVWHGLRFVTFDANMPMRVVRGATLEHLVVL
ncbi:MAG: VapC toxin family PIN domain ribonuclease [Burkholderiales bacterium]|nr:VapC toxin family PIN domain ribonuclease [Burkholderiales bacterium]